MARSTPPRSRMLRSGIEYLEERYPGISSDTVEYRHERQPDGSEYLTVRLAVADQAAGDTP